ncbi:hypothetical protein QYE76_029219 [Lolium multiflorum]|uniref:Transposon protein, putative, CACTA, En/Spm sub-class n=1 Tax=Lolium multiflorum TaxID=4521 RepID=A0AAD8QNR6_LOLMU|nr:hypothetical protein QYE76_029219 [Lolium multiflorum]
MMEDGDEEEDNDDQYRSMFSECDDTAMDDNEEEGGEEQASDDPVDDDLRRAISDARRDCGTDKERLQFDKMLEDHHKLLYPGCEDGHRKLGSILELLKWKAEVGVTDSGFEKLMIILKKLFPRNNELPISTYEAKKLVCPLGLDVQKIHACINDCILYRGEKYENLNKCPICGALRYKIRKDDPGDVEGEPPRKRVPAKVMWYAPIIPRLKRLFRNKEHAKLLRWHMEECKKDAMLRHPADGRQWRNIGREFPDFAAVLVGQVTIFKHMYIPRARHRFYFVLFLRQGVVRYMLYHIEQRVHPRVLILPTALVPVAATNRDKRLGLISANLITLSHGFHRMSNTREAEALRLELPLPARLPHPDRLVAERRRRTVPPIPLGVPREMAITNHYYFDLTPEQRRNPQWHPDYIPTWDSFFINRCERAVARYEEDGPPPSNFNEAGRRMWWRGRTLQSVMAYRGPRLRYPQSQPTRGHPPRFDNRDPDASDDDGDYDDYSGDYYRARHDYD